LPSSPHRKSATPSRVVPPTQVLPTVKCTAAATVTARAVYGIAATWRAQVRPPVGRAADVFSDEFDDDEADDEKTPLDGDSGRPRR
jgi:hypothetical protein